MNITRRPVRHAAAFAVGMSLLASCGSDETTSLDTVAAVDDVTDDTAGDSSGGSTPAPSGEAASDTTYLDLFFDQGILYNPFSGDAVGGDIFYLEPECNDAVSDLSSFTAARNGVDAASMLASLEAAGGDVPANFSGALAEWQGFIADHSATYAGPYFPVSQGQLDDTTLRTVLVDPAVVDMLDAYTSLELRMPDDYIAFLTETCTYTGV